MNLSFAKAAALVAAIPVLIYANASGPDPGLAGVPNEVGTCAACHGSGVNNKGGSVTVTFSTGNTYAAGQVQHLVVKVADPTARRWGFQLTARLAGSASTQAGGFKSTDSTTQVVCSNTRLSTAQLNTTGTCPTANPLMYVEQTASGTRLGTTGSTTFAFDWTPPATASGTVTLYVAANAANGNGNDDSGDHVYTATYSLTAAAVSVQPAISANGVVNGATFAQGIEAGSWVTIQGANLTTAVNCDVASNPGPGCRTWSSSDFANGTPTSLDGVSVSIGGKAAYVYYVSPTQINVQAPDIAAGTVDVTVTNANGTSNTAQVSADDFAPGFFQAGQYAIATHQDGTLVAPSSAIPGATPAARGETVILWGTGFGAVAPSVAAGQTSSQAMGNTIAYVSAPPNITIGGVTATVVGAALNPGALGLYQIAITVPNGVVSGDQAIVANAGGKTSPKTVMFAVK